MVFLKTISFCLLLLLPLFLKGQQENLILNGSLEDFYSCPFESDATITKARHWNAGVPGGLSSTDYFHGCTGNIPNNNLFYVQPADGLAFGAFGMSYTPFDTIIHGIREFASGQLKSCLEVGKRYKIEFSIQAPYFYNNSWMAFDCFEIYFHPNQFAFSADNMGVISRYHEVANQVLRVYSGDPIKEQGIGHRLEQEFVASGNECFFTVGCFNRIQAENVAFFDSIPFGINTQFGAYYLYDNFVLTEIPDDTTPEPTPEPVVPNVLTPNGDGINDFWVIENLPPGTAVAIYNRWGQQVYFSPAYANNWAGEGLPAGNYIAELVYRDMPPRRLAIYLKRE